MLSFAWKEPNCQNPWFWTLLSLQHCKTVDQGFTQSVVHSYNNPSKLLQKSICGDIYTCIPDINHLCLLSLFLISLCQFYLFKELLVDFLFSHSAFNFTVFWTSKTGFYFLSSACFEFIFLFFPLHSWGGSLEYKFEIFPPL